MNNGQVGEGNATPPGRGMRDAVLSEVLGQGGKVNGVNLKPMPSSGLSMMTGFLRNRVDLCDVSGLLVGGETRDMCHSGIIEERARALCDLGWKCDGRRNGGG